MGEVEVQRLVEWKSPRIVVKCEVGLSAFAVEDMLLKTSKYFLDITNADGSASWGLEVIVPRKGEVNGVLEAQPFLVSEQIAERRVSKCYGLVRAKGLRTGMISDVLRKRQKPTYRRWKRSTCNQ